jgi:hypothetical protein
VMERLKLRQVAFDLLHVPSMNKADTVTELRSPATENDIKEPRDCAFNSSTSSSGDVHVSNFFERRLYRETRKLILE